ncbi:hypothetical protein L226DRAFT_567756 [Lentinus tigrinus ALCF2SS1-7]|uniref:uncharacterized protein n=1 Tax=Lentinus tigrinus ALCF2SS1-7 TaxID=1328758 RepID=UPI0011661370|nr:hypothetical protein L226DRAFT_567756 [Lentinus tigrinus ALCF2SS1-7]
MATAVHHPSPDSGAPLNEVAMGLVSPNPTGHTHSNSYSQRLSLNEFDYSDDRYPRPTSLKTPISARSRPGGFDPAIDAGMTAALRASYDKTHAPGTSPPQKAWIGENITAEPVEGWDPATHSGPLDTAVLEAQASGAELTSPAAGKTPVNSSFPDSPAANGLSNEPPADLRRSYADLPPQSTDMGQRLSSVRPSGDQYDSNVPGSPSNVNLSLPPGAGPSTPVVSSGAASSPRHPSLPAGGIGAGPSASGMSPIVPLSAGPTYNPTTMQIPISPKPRAYAQHPTYITPSTAPAMQPSFSPPQVPKEEICVECAMRDQDMADVDVTSPGVWERESDVLYEDLCRREAEEEASGHASSDNHSRPRAKGGKLTEENLKFWLSINPKEPSSRQQTLDQYVKSQRSLLEADALARARALRESRLLDEKMRDTFSQLRRSAYELGSSSQPTDDTGVLRIKSPRVAAVPSSSGPVQGHSREVTLLENGMIVEHVDLRKEEKEERERKRKEERRERSRARKSSRSSRSAADVASVYSMPLASPLPQVDSGFFSNPRDSRYSQSFSPRPSSVLTVGGDRPQTLLRAQSQASFSDMQSLGSASPRRSRFFGFKNLSAAWHSRDSMAPSGSMIDMHVALQQEQAYFAAHPSAIDISSNTPTLRASQSWPRAVTSPEPPASSVPATTKKKNGFKKIWKLVTGHSKAAGKGASVSRSVDRHEDDMPLAPPPPLSYLVDREGGSRRHVSTPSLLSSVSPNQFSQSQWAPSPPTAPSSALPSPTSSRYPVPETQLNSDSQKEQVVQDVVPDHRISALELGPSNENELDGRGRTTHSSSRTLSSLGPATPGASPPNRPQSVVMVSRDKSLPPLPGDAGVEFPSHPMPDARPQTMYDLLQTPSTGRGLLPPQAPFRTQETRRQSFGGMASTPHPAVQTLPSRSPYARGQLNVPPFLAEEKYSEFGASSPALTQWGATQAGKRSLTTPHKPKQRRSKFGLASLFGKKSVEVDRDSQVFTNSTANGSVEPLDYNPYRSSTSEQRDEQSYNGFSGPGSAHSSNAPRMSVASKKNIAELVDQDPEFVAYRYPSSDQRLEVLR